MGRFRPGSALGAALIVLLVASACDTEDHLLDTPCNVDGDCAGYESFDSIGDWFYAPQCNEPYCEAGWCSTRPRDGALPDTTRDCRRDTCSGGTLVVLYTPSDRPSAPDCQIAHCVAVGFWSLDPAPEGATCSTGLCREGKCVSREDYAATDAGTDAGDAGTDAADAADVDASDAG